LTRAMCPPGSIHDQLVTHWPAVRSYVLRDGRLFLSLMADGGIYEFEPRVTAEAPAATASATTARYLCGAAEVTTRVAGESLELTIGGKSFTLAHTKAASGARYASSGAPEVTFWSKGRVATLGIGKTTYPECVQQ
jgi:membrane-bound inhibitor of C-type lysozyme